MTGRKILVTGTSWGLGAAVAEAVIAAGDQVFSTSRTPPATGRQFWVQSDLGDIDRLAGLVAELGGLAAGPFDGVVFNAAVAEKTQTQWAVAQVEHHFRVNALAPFALWDELGKQGLVGAPCNVVLLGSFLQNGNLRQPAYAMSKAALWSWMRSFTMSQDTEHPVSMNMIWPGRVATPTNPRRPLPAGDPNSFYSAQSVADVVLRFLQQPPGGPRGTTVDLGRS